MYVRIERSDEAGPVSLDERDDPVIRCPFLVTWGRRTSYVCRTPNRPDLDRVRDAQAALDLRRVLDVVPVVPGSLVPVPHKGAGNKKIGTHVPHVAVAVGDLAPPGSRLGKRGTIVGKEGVDPRQLLGRQEGELVA